MAPLGIIFKRLALKNLSWGKRDHLKLIRQFRIIMNPGCESLMGIRQKEEIALRSRYYRFFSFVLPLNLGAKYEFW